MILASSRYLYPMKFLERLMCITLELCFRNCDRMKRSSEYKFYSLKFNSMRLFSLMERRGIRPPLTARDSTLCS